MMNVDELQPSVIAGTRPLWGSSSAVLTPSRHNSEQVFQDHVTACAR